jgi:hypothetical protein
VCQKTVDPRDADIDDFLHARTVVSRGHGRLFGNREVGGSRAHDQDEALADCSVRRFDGHGPRPGPVQGAGDLRDQLRRPLRERARDEELSVVLQDRLGDLDQFLGRLALAVDDLGMPAAQLALDVELGVPLQRFLRFLSSSDDRLPL